MIFARSQLEVLQTTLTADWYDPELNAKVEEFCRHYATVLLPSRPAMPRHKELVSYYT